MNKYVFRLPDNWHAHLRQDKLMDAIIHHFSIYGRVLCMGNTTPLTETADQALSYQRDILNHNVSFEPVMCIMLTQDTTPEMIYKAKRKGIKFVKFIPVGTSTGAVKGLKLYDLEFLRKIFPVIKEAGMYILLHAELISWNSKQKINLLRREEEAIPVIAMYQKICPGIKMTIEHASTVKMINFVRSCNSGNLRATLTPHHALLIYSDAFYRGNIINPYNHCFPVLKSENSRQAVIKAMVSGDERFFAGTDAAPHWKKQKEGIDPPAGIFFGSSAYLRYLKIFEEAGAINKFENFTSRFGAETYGFPLNTGTITIAQEAWRTPIQENGIRFCMGGEILRHKIVGVNCGC